MLKILSFPIFHTISKLLTHTWGRLYGDFQPELKFQLGLSRLNSKFLFKMTLQLHVKISTRHTELKFLQPGIKNPNFPYD